MTTGSNTVSRGTRRDAKTVEALMLIAAVLVLALGLWPSRSLPESPSGAIEAQ